MKLEKLMGSVAKPGTRSFSTTGVAQADVTEAMNGLKGVITPDLVEKVKGVYTFNITDATPAEWYLDLKNGSGNLAAGKFGGNSDVNLTMNSDVFLKLTNGSLKATNAFMAGKLKIKGN